MAKSYEAKVLYHADKTETSDSHVSEVMYTCSLTAMDTFSSIDGLMDSLSNHLGLYGEEQLYLEAEAVTVSCGFTMIGKDVDHPNETPTRQMMDIGVLVLEFAMVMYFNVDGRIRYVVHFLGYDAHAAYYGTYGLPGLPEAPMVEVQESTDEDNFTGFRPGDYLAERTSILENLEDEADTTWNGYLSVKMEGVGNL